MDKLLDLIKVADRWLISRFEAISDWTYEWLGIGSRELSLLFTVAMLADVAVFFFPLLMKHKAWIFLVMVFAWTLCVLHDAWLELHEPPINETETANPKKYFNSAPRVFNAVWAFGFLFLDIYRLLYTPELFDGFWYQYFAVQRIFTVCDRRPPSKSRLRKFVEGLFPGEQKLVPVLER